MQREILVLYINADDALLRRQQMEEELARAALQGLRVDAIAGAPEKLNGLVDVTAFRRRHHAALRSGEVGCYLSHVRAIRQFMSSAADLACILEDDVRLAPGFAQILGRLANCRDEWDVVKLHVTHVGATLKGRKIDTERWLASLPLRHGSAAAYVINRRAGAVLLDGLLPMTVPYDHEFDRAWKYRLRLRLVTPMPVSRASFPSTITQTPRMDSYAVVNERLHKPWYQQAGMLLFRGLNDIARLVYALSTDRVALHVTKPGGGHPRSRKQGVR